MAGARSIADAARLGEGGSLRISASFLFGRLVLAPFVGKFIGGRADLSAHLKFDNSPVDPLREDFDIAIQVSEPSASYQVRSKLASASLKLYAAPKVSHAINTVKDLERVPAIRISNEAASHVVLAVTDGHRTWGLGCR